MAEQQNLESQPFLPRVGMIWFFVIVTLVAVALGVVRSAEQGQSLAAAMVFLTIFVATFALLSGICFVVAFLFGAMEKAVAGEKERLASPFISGQMPEQIIPPTSGEEN